MNNRMILCLIIIMVACLSQFASDIYAPALTVIASSLDTSLKLAQLSMSVYMLGVALSLLIYGPISDGVGRKMPLLIGLSIMFVGSLVCLSAGSIKILILGRLLQGAGAGACAGLWRSIFRDIFSGDDLAKYGSYFATIIVFVVPAAPFIGAYLEHFFSWRTIFIFMAGYALLALTAVMILYQETSIHHHRDHLKWSYLIKTFGEILSHRLFMGMTICCFLCYGAFFSWFTIGPILLIKNLGMTTVEFGWLSFVGGGIAYALAGWLNGRFVKRFGMSNMMRFGWAMMIFSGLLLLLGYFIFGQTILAIAIPGILFYFGSTFIWPNAFAIAFTPLGHIAGYAGAAYSFMQLGGGAVISGIAAHLPHTNPLALGSIFILAPLASWVFYECCVKHLQKA